MSPNKRPSDLIQSVERAAGILDALASSDGALTVRQIAEQLELKPATVHHLVNTLEFVGYVTRRGSGYLLDSTKVLEHYAALTRSTHVDPIGLSAIRELADRTRDTVYLASWVGGSVTITSVAEGSRAVRVTDVYAGLRGHEHTRASGKVLLAERTDEEIVEFLAQNPMEPRTANSITTVEEFLEEVAAIRASGHSVDREEYTLGVTCIAAVLMVDGVSSGSAVAVSVPTHRFEESGESLLADLKAATQAHRDA